MDQWRTELNRLAVEFQYGVGSIDEAHAWCDEANAEQGEVNPKVWSLLTTANYDEACELLLSIAAKVNDFDPRSLSAEPFAMGAMAKLIDKFLTQAISVQQFCARVNDFDSTFKISSPFSKRSSHEAAPRQHWMGHLWNCCDWLPDSWTHKDVPEMLAEAQRVRALLVRSAAKRSLDGAG